eukprot:753618-Hanusia_phi.AAC.2
MGERSSHTDIANDDLCEMKRNEETTMQFERETRSHPIGVLASRFRVQQAFLVPGRSSDGSGTRSRTRWPSLLPLSTLARSSVRREEGGGHW